MRRSWVLALMIMLVALPMFAQVPTGTLTGHVTDGTNALPGVTVSVTSPNLQGTRSAVTTVNGDYILAFLPPGEYRVRFELQGFQTLDTSIKISAAQTAKLDAVMPVARIAEEVTVAGSYETISTSGTASTTLEADLQNKLPVPRDLVNAVALAPGVSQTGPNNGLVISGAQSYESLFLINGVVVNENVRGQATNLFIEDAIQETTTSTSGISAEYGRFAGGVVNMLTKSGGNEVRGSFRTTFDNDKWTAPTPKTVEHSRADKINETYEATLGGYVWKDRIWYFLAGRDRKTTGSDQTIYTDIAFPTQVKERRWEGKLTVAATPEHRFVGSYIDRERSWVNYGNFPYPTIDLATIYDRQIPETLQSFNYTGVLTDNFFVEGQYSKRTLEFDNSGGRSRDLYAGTPIVGYSQGIYGNAGWWCGVCTPETRDNEDYLAKGSWFLSTQNMGSHDIVFGYDQFSDMVNSLNYQSATDFTLYTPTFTYAGTNWYPEVYGDGSAELVWWPILIVGTGTDFTQAGVFINDKWRLNNNWSFNIGARWDKNDGKTSIGKTVAKDSLLSPRLGVVFDPKGDGEWVFNAGLARYVMTISGTGNVADRSPQSPSVFEWGYYGPEFNTDCDPATGANCTSPQDVLRGVFAWFDGIGGTSAFPDYGASIPGYNRIIRGSLDSPYAEEISAGFSKRLGNTGLFRLDYVHRNFKNGYATRVDTGTGQVDVFAIGRDWGTQDLGLIVNSNWLKRQYDGVSLQGNLRLHDRLTIGGNYTWSHSSGNYVGEGSGTGPVTATNYPDYYPEYQDVKWSAPSGDLPIDQRHRGRVWAVWDLISSRHNTLSVSLMESYFSGTPYGAVGAVRSYLYVPNPGYVNVPSSVTYYFTGRDAFRTDNITRTDISVNYGFRFPALGKDVEIFLIPQLTNAFNEHGVTAPNTTVYDYTTYSARLASFNPFTTTPVECPQGASTADCKAVGANWQRGPNFGKPTSPAAYQTPRTFSLSVGFRF
jgi:outer membrane receptor for ferrienterochelin and colicin